MLPIPSLTIPQGLLNTPPHLQDLPPPPSPPKLLHRLHRHRFIAYPLLQEPLQIPPKRLRLQHLPPTQPLRDHRGPSRSTPLLLLNHTPRTPTLSHIHNLLPSNRPRPPPHNHNPQLQPTRRGGRSSNHLPQTPRIRNRLLIQQQFNLLNWDPRLIGDRELDVQSRGRGERERGEG